MFDYLNNKKVIIVFVGFHDYDEENDE